MRVVGDWLDAYVKYAGFTEAPAHVHFWTGVSAIAGVLGRKVWINQHSFNWYANHYIFFVGPPDVISKSTTVKLGMSLLKRVPGFTLGPTSCSWQALVETMVKEHEMDYDLGNGAITKLASCTVSSTELGNFLKVKDGEFLDTMISLWDGDTIDKKLIKDGGSVFIENPLLNLNGCTTPSWMSSNIPEHMLEGGLLSRVIFVFGDTIDHPVAYPADNVPKNILETENNLVKDLIAMEKLKGPMILSPEAKTWATTWYNEMKSGIGDGNETVRGHLTRKQTHVHKLAMVLSVSRGDSLIIELCDVQKAVEEIEKLEDYRVKIMSNVGKTLDSIISDRLLTFIQSKKACRMDEAYRSVHDQLPTSMAFLDLLNGLVKAGYVKEVSLGGVITLVAQKGKG